MNEQDPLEAHVGAMLTEATRLHKEAMSYLDKPKANPLPQLRQAKRLLEQAELLASDAASYLDATQMNTALAELHQQQGQVEAMIVQVEAAQGRTKFAQVEWVVAIVVVAAMPIVTFAI